MTSQNRWLFNFIDILYVRFECKKCGFVFSVHPQDWQRLPYACGNCQTQWLMSMSAEEQVLQSFSKALENLQKMSNDRFSVQLEVNGPSS